MKRNLLFLALALMLATFVVAQSDTQQSTSSSSSTSSSGTKKKATTTKKTTTTTTTTTTTESSKPQSSSAPASTSSTTTTSTTTTAPAKSAAAAGGEKGDAAAGRRPYMRLCSKCHLPDGKGDQSLAEQLGVKVRALGSPEVQAKSDAELAKESRDGIGQMKPVPGITDKDLANIVAYMRTMKP